MKMNNVELCRWLVWEILESNELALAAVDSIDEGAVDNIKARMEELPMFSPSDFLKSLGKTFNSISLKVAKTEDAINKMTSGKINSHIPLPEIKAYLRLLLNDMKVVNFMMNFVRVHYDVVNIGRPLCFKDIERLLTSAK